MNLARFFLASLLAGPLAAAQAADREPKPPARNWAEEPQLPQFSVERAAEFLDAGARAHEDDKCVTCHGTFAYLLARPALPVPSGKQAEVRADLEKWGADAADAGLNEAGPPVKVSAAVMAGAVLAQYDAATTGTLQPATRQALDLMWRVQQPDGGFNWVMAAEPPIPGQFSHASGR